MAFTCAPLLCLRTSSSALCFSARCLQPRSLASPPFTNTFACKNRQLSRFAPSATPASTVVMVTKTDFPALVRRHLGTWEGQYYILNPTGGTLIDSHKCKIEVGVRGERYSQRNTYTWDSEKQQILEFSGRMVDGELRVTSEKLDGYVVIVDDDTLCFTAKLKKTGSVIHDVIRLLTEDARARTWQVSSDAKVERLVHVEEERTSRDDAFFEVADDPWV